MKKPSGSISTTKTKPKFILRAKTLKDLYVGFRNETENINTITREFDPGSG